MSETIAPLERKEKTHNSHPNHVRKSYNVLNIVAFSAGILALTVLATMHPIAWVFIVFSTAMKMLSSTKPNKQVNARQPQPTKEQEQAAVSLLVATTTVVGLLVSAFWLTVGISTWLSLSDNSLPMLLLVPAIVALLTKTTLWVSVLTVFSRIPTASENNN